jgi:hypothetical protein
MQDISYYIPETNHVSRVCNVAASLYLRFMTHVVFPMLNVLYFYISSFRYMCAVSNMAVCCSSLVSCSTVM